MWYRPGNESSISTPCILLHPDRIEENISRMIAIAGGPDRLRPHVKTHKIAEIIKLQLRYGINKFKCATLSEVEMVAGAGGTDILLAYPLLGPGINRFLQLMKRYPDAQFALTLDSMEACRQLCEQAHGNGTPIRVFLDLDNGMHRSGISPGESGELIDYIVKQPELSLEGLHIYDGHIHEVDFEERKSHCERDFRSVSILAEELEAGGVQLKELACGGTPTFPIHAFDPARTLCPGTPLLWDAGYAQTIPDLDFLPAAVVTGRVISKPENNICLDLGYKAIASEMKQPRLHFLNLDVKEVLNHSEEHLVISLVNPGDLEIGDLVYALPFHVCPTMALHEYVHIVENGMVSGSWKVAARNR